MDRTALFHTLQVIRMGLALADLRYFSFSALAGAAFSIGIAAGVVDGTGILHNIPHFDFTAAGVPGRSCRRSLNVGSVYPSMVALALV